MRGITIKNNIGIGDTVQFSSLPENYFRTTGEQLVDLSRSWIFDHNPYVLRGVEADEVSELWNFGPQQYEWPKSQTGFYRSNAEITAQVFEAETFLNRPRLYQFEDFPYEKRSMILFHPFGKSHGELPFQVIDHVIKKYEKTQSLYQIGLPWEPDLGLPRIMTESPWALAEVISKAKMLIGVDSGPAWIAACYPDVIVKKVRVREFHGQPALKDWYPLQQSNHHSFWDDRSFQIYNISEDDLAYTWSYKKL